MPTITFELNDLRRLLGKSISIKEIEILIHYAKGELEGYDKKTDEVSVSLDDTNLPYLWSAEGIARLFRGVLGINLGIQGINISGGDYSIEVDTSVNSVRPFISSFVFRGKPLTDYMLRQLIQLQEKLDNSYGRKRKKTSIGLYSYKRIRFPIHYTTTSPNAIKFVPLEFSKELTPAEILEEHPKGREYGWILKGFKRYPLLLDSNNEVLSLPPIINSNFTGKVETGDTDILFEATGTDEGSLRITTNIFAQALYERGYKICGVKVKYKNRKIVTPQILHEKIRISNSHVKNILGLDLSEATIKKTLEMAGYNFSNYLVTIPHYRADIMHPFDVIEDVAIMYGFNNIKSAPLKSYTVGSTTPMVGFVDKIREIVVGLGYQEVMSSILSNKETLYKKAMIADFGTIEIENFMSENYSCVRTWLTPLLMEFLSKNKHVDYPQRIFEQGLVTLRKRVNDSERIAMASAHTKADFTEMKQVLDALTRALGVSYSIKPVKHGSFIEGRCGRVYVNKVPVAYIGEIHPGVLSAWGLEVPVSALELNLSDLMPALRN